MSVLEKIRAEIEREQIADFIAVQTVLEIIDKYASEECDNDCEHCVYLECPKEPLRTKGELWDMGRAKCEKHDLITDFANHGKFKRLDTCEDYEPQEREKAHCGCTDAEIAKSFIEDVRAVKDLLPQESEDKE